ncbi:MAG: sulfatase, partial [Rikenellaceae bacterium]
MKRLIIPCLVASAATSCSQNPNSGGLKSGDKAHPNVILFVADDHGIDALGCYGNDVIKTPSLDSLAATGVRFDNAFCTSSTSAVSRTVLMTGLFGHSTATYGHSHDYHHFSTYEGTPSLPMLLAEGGYKTARIGKYHLAPESVFHFDNTFEADPRSTAEMADACRDFILDKDNNDKPFFLYFCTDDPHRDSPFAHEKWDEPNDFGNRPEGFENIETIEYDPNDVYVPSFLPDTYITRREIAQYYQSISRIDQGFDRLMQHLRESGKADNTIVIYISDNGMAFPGAKTTLYEAGMRLPCIISGAGIEGKNVLNKEMISWVDMTPTILEMTGTAYDKNQFHGKSFKGLVDGSGAKGADVVYASHVCHEVTMYYPMRVVRQKQYKLIWNIAYKLDYPFASDLWAASTWQQIERGQVDKLGDKPVNEYLYRPEFELYDIVADPFEAKNLSLDPKYASIVESMKKDMKQWQIDTKDPWLIMWNHDNSLQGTGV